MYQICYDAEAAAEEVRTRLYALDKNWIARFHSERLGRDIEFDSERILEIAAARGYRELRDSDGTAFRRIERPEFFPATLPRASAADR